MFAAPSLPTPSMWASSWAAVKGRPAALRVGSTSASPVKGTYIPAAFNLRSQVGNRAALGLAGAFMAA